MWRVEIEWLAAPPLGISRKESIRGWQGSCYTMSNVGKRRAMEREYMHGHEKWIVQSGTELAGSADRWVIQLRHSIRIFDDQMHSWAGGVAIMNDGERKDEDNSWRVLQDIVKQAWNGILTFSFLFFSFPNWNNLLCLLFHCKKVKLIKLLFSYNGITTSFPVHSSHLFIFFKCGS